jgi:hypothetical protein
MVEVSVPSRDHKPHTGVDLTFRVSELRGVKMTL